MPTPQRQQMRILMRVVSGDWFCLTNADDQSIEAMITTGHLALKCSPGGRPHAELAVTQVGMNYLRWLISDNRHVNVLSI